jgi:hypothetical protein
VQSPAISEVAFASVSNLKFSTRVWKRTASEAIIICKHPNLLVVSPIICLLKIQMKAHGRNTPEKSFLTVDASAKLTEQLTNQFG